MAHVLVAILGLSLLMTVHEAGHYAMARLFGIRVTHFSIGFGPALVKWKPRNSDTTFQICIVPLLAYVKMDGNDPTKEIDRTDDGLYDNKPVYARAATVLGGPVANYLAASLLIFGLALTGVRERAPMTTGEAARVALVAPWKMTVASAEGVASLVRHRTTEGLTGPVGMVKHVASESQRGVRPFAGTLVALSVAIGFFNLLPFPFLDGGRLIFLALEAVMRRRPNRMVEAIVHATGLLLFLGLSALITVRDLMS